MRAPQLILLLLVAVVFWVMVMRPARTQQKRVSALQSDLEVGQRVVLSSGIFGTIRSLDTAQVELEIAPGTVVTVARQAVVRRADEVATAEGDDPARDDDQIRNDDRPGADPAHPANDQD